MKGLGVKCTARHCAVQESCPLKHFFIRNRLEAVINSNYHCTKLCRGRCRVETGESNYGHLGLKIKNNRCELSLTDILWMHVGVSVHGATILMAICHTEFQDKWVYKYFKIYWYKWLIDLKMKANKNEAERLFCAQHSDTAYILW